MMTRRIALAALLAALLPGASAAAQEKLRVVATFSILGDFVRNVGGDRVEVTTLIGPNNDAHVYQPSPADARKLAAAKVVFINGLGFEGWIERLVKASGTKATIVRATNAILPLTDSKVTPQTRHAHKGHSHGDGKLDPHAWHTINNARMYVANIVDALKKADPAGADAYERNSGDYLSKLQALEQEIKATLDKVPMERRRVITTHDAFRYFAQFYEFEFIAPQGVSTESEASARDVARIIAQIKKQKIPAVFLENVTDQRLLKRIADETGAKIGGTLYSDALTDENGPAATYIDLIRHNVRTLSTALTM
jgi:zinc/manganese transport system substrate-binding protein